MRHFAPNQRGFRQVIQNKSSLFFIFTFIIILIIGFAIYLTKDAVGAGIDGITVDQNAYINGSSTAENGIPSDYQVVEIGDTLQYQFNIDNQTATSSTPPLVSNPTFQVQNSLARPAQVSFKNGSFETPVIPATSTVSNIFIPQSQSGGWSTTASDGQIEIQRIVPRGNLSITWAGQFADHTDDGGTQYAELNANLVGTLYQDCATVPGTRVYYEFFHGARGAKPGGQLNTDILNFYLYAPNRPASTGFILQSTATCITDPLGIYSPPYTWTHNSGSYIVPAGQTTTRFAFESYSTTSGYGSMGNYLDGVRLFTSSYVELTKSDNAPNQRAQIGDTVTYSIVAKNTGEADSSNTQVTDTLPAGTELVPNSVRIDNTLTNNYTYDATSRQIIVNVGAGATKTSGGLIKGINSFSIDCNNSYLLTFQIKVNDTAIAQNLKYENQASVNFSDRRYEADTNYTNYSNVDAFGLDIPDQPATFTYTLPAGLDLIDYSTPDGASVSLDGDTITWKWTNLPHGVSPITVTTKVNPKNSETEFVSHGTLDIAGESLDSNYTYHRLLTDFNLQKNAYINDSLVAENGSADDYQIIKPSDSLKYVINFNVDVGSSGLPADLSDTPTFQSPLSLTDPNSGSFIELNLTNTAAGGKLTVDDSFTYVLTVKNSGADDARAVQISQVLPAGITYIPNTVQIDGTATSNFTYDSVANTLTVNVGAAATNTLGGLLKGQNSTSTDCQDAYTITFQAQVNNDAIAANLLYESQAQVTYADRDPATSASLVNYSNVTSIDRSITSLAATVVDSIPEGMNITSYDAPAGSSFTQDGQICTWTWDHLSSGEHTVTVTVAIDPTSSKTQFVNSANVTIAGLSKDTNFTYHTDVVPITERFVDYADPTNILQADNLINLTAGLDYTPAFGTPPATLTKDGVTYKYWGYQVDNGQIHTGSPDPANLPQAVDGPHTIAYLYIEGTESVAQKNAFVNDGSVDNGSEDNPVSVLIGDNITYQISVDNPKKPSPGADFEYDVLFVVDWSGSMVTGLMTDGGNNAIQYARNLSSDMSQYILNQYPGSRVGLLGMLSYTWRSNLYDINSSYVASGGGLKADTPFVGTMADFNSIIKPCFSTPAPLSNDDVAIFLGAGIDKLMGNSTVYGSNPAYGPGPLIPRDDKTRIPVIVLISDFQIPRTLENNYWTACLKLQADRFHEEYPDGILMTVRMDTDLNNKVQADSEPRYNTKTYDDLMAANVAPAGHGDLGWNFSKVSYNTSYATALSSFQNTFAGSVPPPPPTIPPSTVTDVIPDGLVIVSTDPAAQIDGQTVTWDLNELPAGPTLLTVQTQVATAGSFTNTANIAPWNEDAYNTNTTYHKALKNSFSFYKVDASELPLSGVSFNLYNCPQATDPDFTPDWLASDDPSSTWQFLKTATSDSDGLVQFDDLTPGDYMLAETQTRPGYALPLGQWLISVSADNSTKIAAHGTNANSLPPAFLLAPDDSPEAGSLLLPNYHTLILPFSGGTGVILFTILGIVIIGAAVIFAFTFRRRRNKD